MRTLHLFLPEEQFSGDTATILGQDHIHLTKVLRARIGSSLILLDNLGKAFCATLESIARHSSIVRIDSQIDLLTEPTISIVIVQALGKGTKFEEVIQHGTEIGAREFWPIISDFCQIDISDTNVVKKLERWRHISKCSAEQSHRLFIPPVKNPISFDEMLAGFGAKNHLQLLLHTGGGLPSFVEVVRDSTTETFTVMIGPEGGWSDRELKLAAENEINIVQMGPRVLRTETAGLAALSMIIALKEPSA